MLNLRVFSILTLLLSTLPAVAFSYTSDEQNRAFTQHIRQSVYETELTKTHQFEISPEIGYTKTKYKEGGENKGTTYGVFAAYTFRLPGGGPINVFHIDVHTDYMRMDHNGSINNPDTPYAGDFKDTDDYAVEPRLWIGKDFAITPNSRLTPFVGIGYRFVKTSLKDKVSSSNEPGFDQRSQYLYAPIGAEFHFIPASGWEIGFNGEYDIFIQGWQTYYTSQVDLGFFNAALTGLHVRNVDIKQTKGFGLRGSVDLIKKGDHLNFLVSPYIRYWNVKLSKVDDLNVGLYEAASTTTEMGVKLGVQF